MWCVVCKIQQFWNAQRTNKSFAVSPKVQRDDASRINLTPARRRWRSTSLKEAPITLLSWEEKRPSSWQKHVSGYKELRGKWSKRCVSCFCRRPEEEVLAPCSECVIAGAKGQCWQEDGVNRSSSIAPATGVRAVPMVALRVQRSSSCLAAFCESKGGRINLGMAASEKQKRK